MGCQACQTSDVQEHINLKNELIKLKVACDLYKNRKDVELKTQEKLLSIQLIKPLKNRSRTLERTIIRGNVRFSNQKLSTTGIIKFIFTLPTRQRRSSIAALVYQLKHK